MNVDSVRTIEAFLLPIVLPNMCVREDVWYLLLLSHYFQHACCLWLVSFDRY